MQQNKKKGQFINIYDGNTNEIFYSIFWNKCYLVLK